MSSPCVGIIATSIIVVVINIVNGISTMHHHQAGDDSQNHPLFSIIVILKFGESVFILISRTVFILSVSVELWSISAVVGSDGRWGVPSGSGVIVVVTVLSPSKSELTFEEFSCEDGSAATKLMEQSINNSLQSPLAIGGTPRLFGMFSLDVLNGHTRVES